MMLESREHGGEEAGVTRGMNAATGQRSQEEEWAIGTGWDDA